MMRTLPSALASSIAWLALTACSPYSPDLGGVPFKCGDTEPRCPEGYSCTASGTVMQCVADSGNIVDAAPVGFQCADDSTIEMSNGANNDTIATAYATPVQSQFPMIPLAGLAICPENDKDTYLVNITRAMSNLEAVTSWDSGNPISVKILGAGSATLAMGATSGPMSQRAYVANLPVGQYYVQASAAATVKNNYKLTIKTD